VPLGRISPTSAFGARAVLGPAFVEVPANPEGDTLSACATFDTGPLEGVLAVR